MFVTPHSNYINIISACLGHRKLLHQKQIHSTAARKGILMRLIPIFWVTVGRKTYEEKKVLEPSRLYTSCAVRHEPCSSVLCNTQLSCSASAGRRNAMRTQGPKPPSLQLWISAWTAPCPRRWECWLSLAPAVALRRILPGEVSDGPSFLVPRLKPFFQWGKYSVLVHFETGILWVNLNSSHWVQKLEYKCTPDLEIHLVKCFHPGRPGNTQDVSHNSVLHFFRFQCPPAARCDSAGLLGVFLSSCRLNSNLTLNSANLINIQKPHMFVFPPCSLYVTGTECYSKANLTARTAYNVRRFGKHS